MFPSCVVLLQEDYRKITVEKKGEVNFFTSQMIQDCMRKVITVNLHQTVKVMQAFCMCSYNNLLCESACKVVQYLMGDYIT